MLWTCKGGAENGDCKKQGYYLQFVESSSIDINSTHLQETFEKSHQIDEAKLNQLSTDALLELLGWIVHDKSESQ